MGPHGVAGGRLPCLPTYLGKETHCWRNEPWAVSLVGKILCRASRTSSPGPQRSGWTRFLPVLALSPKYSVPLAFPGYNTVMGMTEMVLSCFLAEDSELAWVKTGTRYQAGFPSRDPWGPVGGGRWERPLSFLSCVVTWLRQLRSEDQIPDGHSRPCHSVSPRRFMPAVHRVSSSPRPLEARP